MFKLAKSSITILESYLHLFMVDISEIRAQSDLDWAEILGLQQSKSKVMEFSKDSHRNKLKLLVKPLNKHILK